MTDDDVVYVEHFVRTQLMQRLLENCNRAKLVLNECDRTDFFGIYASDILNFKFTEKDRLLIYTLVKKLKDPNISQLIGPSEETDINQKIKGIGKWFCQKMDATNHQTTPKEKTLIAPTGAQNLLGKMLEVAEKNASKPKQGYRYDDEFKKLAVYNRILSGPVGYKSLQGNLIGCLPSISKTNRYIHRSDHAVIEGVLRCDELLIYLRERNLPLWVSLSEDATRVDNKVQYDVHTNQLIGFTLPILKETGMPVPFTYKARNTEEIIQHFSENASVAHFANTVMAQPIGCGAPFCLLLFGSDNRYTAEDTSNRWITITNELKKVGIGVLSISSDSDPKYNAAMRKNSCLGYESSDILQKNDLFKCGSNEQPPFYVQDHFHILTKMRNLLLKTENYPKKLRFGRFYIQMSHIAKVMTTSSKDQHFLTKTALNPVDIQNVDSAMKICDSKVVKLLKKNVKDSDATSMFLQIMSDVTAAFIDEKLFPVERLMKMWHALFIVRIWRDFIKEHDGLTFKDNFMSSYCYYCIEQNAHSLVLILLYLRKQNLTHLFLPILFNSQACEDFYRKIRSFTSTYSTVANCSIKEILHRINRIQILGEISNDKESGFIFPKELNSDKFSNVNFQYDDFPDETAVINVILQSKSKALNDAQNIGLIKKKGKVTESCCDCSVPPYTTRDERNEDTIELEDSQFEKSFHLIKSELISTALKNYADKFEDQIINETSPYAEVLGFDKRIIVKKSSICWLFKGESFKNSSDRRYRVMGQRNKKKSKAEVSF